MPTDELISIDAPRSKPAPRHPLIDFLVQQRMGCLLLALIATALALPPSNRLRFDQSIESLYSKDNPRLQDYVESKATFGGDEIVIVAFTDPQLFTGGLQLDPNGQRQLREFADNLGKIPGVMPASVQNLASSLALANVLPFLANRRDQIFDLFQGILVGPRGNAVGENTTAVVLRIEPEHATDIPRAETIREIRRLAAAHNPPAYVVGEPVQVHDMFRYVEEDGRVLGYASSILLIIVILVLFRNLKWVVLPVLVVHVTLVWTRALLVASQLQLSMVSSMLTSLVTIIGVATVIHITLYFGEQRRRLGREDALRETLLVLSPAIFWTCATTAGGFAVQLSSHIHPVQSFGLMMALGAMLVLLAAALILPGGILLGHYGTSPAPQHADTRLSRWLHSISDGVEHHPRAVGVGCVVLVLVSLGGFFRLRVETDFTKNFRESSPIVQALDFVEDRLGGAGTWEINIPAPSTLTPEYLERVRQLASKLRAIRIGTESLTKVMAPTDGIDLIPQLPFISSTLEKKLAVLARFQPEFMSSLWNPEKERMRIMLRARERQPSETKLQLIEEVERLAREEFPEAHGADAPRATGLFVLLTFLIESLLGDQWVSSALAAVCIAGMVTVAYRSLRIGLIALVPNLLPIVIVIGAMGWLGMPINIATAMIASVSMGLTVDSSIHYLSGYQRARASGASFFDALRETNQSVGRALVFANLALIAGFLVLTLSKFVPLVYFGLLVSLAMFGGLAGNLVLLPLMLRANRASLP